MNNGRICTKCLIPKSADYFYKHPRGINGLSGQCKDCHRQRKRHLRKDPERKEKDRLYKMFYNKSGARKETFKSNLYHYFSKRFVSLSGINRTPKKKYCTKCNQLKSISEFGKSKVGSFGVYPICKQCNNRRYKKYCDSLSDTYIKKTLKEKGVKSPDPIQIEQLKLQISLRRQLKKMLCTSYSQS